MNRIACGVVPVALLASVGNAQTAWHQQAPLPMGWNLGNAAFNSPRHGFVCGDDRHLFETFDGGRTWQKRMGEDTNSDPFYTMGFGDGMHALVLGNNPTARRTADGGATWVPSPGPDFGSWSHLDFVSGQAAFAGANGACSFTPDGGVTWNTRGFYPDCPIMFGMDFRDENVGLAGGIRSTPHHDEGIYRTVDGGATWTPVFDTAVNDVVWLNDTMAIAIAGVDIYASHDAGLTWDWWGGTVTTGLSDMEVVLPGVICGVSLSGDVWLSTDYGQNWILTLRGIGGAPTVWSVHFSDPLHGWVVGQSGLIFKSVDGGFSWELMTSGVGDEITDIFMHDEQRGMAVTHGGYVLKTENGGGHWTASQPGGFSFYAGIDGLEFLNDQSGVAVGEGPTVLRTYDGGEFWFEIGRFGTLPRNLSLVDAAMIDDYHYFVISNYGVEANLFETFDDGGTWTARTDVPAAFFVDIDIRGSVGWLACACDLFWRTTDGGATWQQRTLPVDYQIADFDFAPDNLTGWAVGWYGSCAKTTNGGVTWQRQSVGGTDAVLLGVKAISATEAWAVGRYGFDTAVFHTVNGGTTWQRQLQPRSVFSLSEIDTVNDKVWVGGYNGVLFANFEASDGCPADLSGASDPNDPRYGQPDGAADLSDFFYFLDQFTVGNDEVADLTGGSDPSDPTYGVPNGVIDTSDFFYYLDQFVQGCP